MDSHEQHEPMGLPTARRHSNATNYSLGSLIVADWEDTKLTGSLELSSINKNLKVSFSQDHSTNYWKKHKSSCMRRIRSTALETCCAPPTNLVPHPNSLEVIGVGSNRNPALPPPSTSLVRNPHLCPYFSYGSEIVYPIAEQSDEHQTSHGPDTDLESVVHNSDSEFEEQNAASPYILVGYDDLEWNKKPKIEEINQLHPVSTGRVKFWKRIG